MFQYLHLVCTSEKLEELLNRYGQEGWRLHTCEPLVLADENGQAMLNLAVVMERMTAPEAQRYDFEEHAAMAMRG